MDNYQYNINYDVNKYLQEKQEYEATQNYAFRAICLLVTGAGLFWYAVTHWA